MMRAVARVSCRVVCGSAWATVEVGVDHALNFAFELVDDLWHAGVAGLGLGFVSQALPPLVLLGEGSRLV